MVNFKIKSDSPTYNDYITRYFAKEVPTVINTTEKDRLELLTNLLVGTKESRYGAIPAPEQLVVIRKVINQAIDTYSPIPILIPFGGIKASLSGDIDIAEFSVITRLAKLVECIGKYHSPGAQINIRIEDIGALHLYGEVNKKAVEKYSSDLVKLIRIVGNTHGYYMFALRESSIMDSDKYMEAVRRIEPLILDYLKTSEAYGTLGFGASFEALKEIGWQGVIPFEQREFYLQRYRNLYPHLRKNEHLEMLAGYLAGSKARHELNGSGAPTVANMDGQYIQISYVQPIPGAPSTMFNNTLYYRTLPLSEARTHMPAWRSLGYLKIAEDGTAKAKIANPRDGELIDKLTPATATITNKGKSVSLNVNYLM